MYQPTARPTGRMVVRPTGERATLVLNGSRRTHQYDINKVERVRLTINGNSEGCGCLVGMVNRGAL